MTAKNASLEKKLGKDEGFEEIICDLV